MADYSFLKDYTGQVHGIWIKNAKHAHNTTLLLMLLRKHDVGEPARSAVIAGDYRVVRNRHNNAGGCFLMFGSAVAPGE